MNKPLMPYLSLPFFDAIAEAKTVLLAGCGGGYDIFTGLPLYFGLQATGKTVHLANLSFSPLPQSGATEMAPGLFRVEASLSNRFRYIPELYLCRWFAEHGNEMPIYCFENTLVLSTGAGSATHPLLRGDA